MTEDRSSKPDLETAKKLIEKFDARCYDPQTRNILTAHRTICRELETALEAAREEFDAIRKAANITADDTVLAVGGLYEQLQRAEQDRDAAVGALQKTCERHCNIKPDELCAVPECPAEPYRPTTEEE
jgi:hypothetical protein